MSPAKDAIPDRSGAIGRTLDNRYRIESVVGRGGMAMVYLATDLRMARPVIIKIPHREFLDSDAFRERFAREIRNLTTLEHPHIVKILDAGEFDGYPFAVLQYLKGGTLKDRLERTGTQSAEEILDWLEPVATTLDYVHTQGIVHRDLTPTNVLYDSGNHVFLTDFGIAKALEGMGSNQTLTRTGVAPGSAPYMGPEAVEGTIGPAYDQYALGVMVYRALSGAYPHEGPTPVAILVGKVTKPPRSLADVAPDLPPGLVEAVMKTLGSDPDHRYPNCRVFVDAFQAATTGKPARSAPPDETELLQTYAAATTTMERPAVQVDAKVRFRYIWVPTQADTEFGRIALEEKASSLQEILLALDLQEKRCELGDRISLEEILAEQGFVDYEEKRRIREFIERREREESDRLFAECSVRLGLTTTEQIDEFETRLTHLRRIGRELPLSEFLVKEGAIREDESVRVFHGQLQARYAREDALFRQALLESAFVSRLSVDKAAARQSELNAQGLPPLPLHSVLMGMGLLDKERSDVIKRAVRRHLITSLPLKTFLDEVCAAS